MGIMCIIYNLRTKQLSFSGSYMANRTFGSSDKNSESLPKDESTFDWTEKLLMRCELYSSVASSCSKGYG